MGIFEAVILGALQGLTEFLPVSSSGHLVLLQRIFGISESALLFDTLVHGGTLLAVLIVLWKDIWMILRRLWQPLTAYLIIGTLPTVAVALLFKEEIEGAFASGGYLGFAFLFTALSLFVSETLASRRAGSYGKSMGVMDSLVIGICQAIAIIPGVSRSGMTLSGALGRHLDREFAARFSFLLSIPAVLGALVLQLKDLWDLSRDGLGASLSGGIGTAPMIAGTLTAAVVGFFAINFMLSIVRRHSLKPFGVYVALLGLLVLTDQYVTHFFF